MRMGSEGKGRRACRRLKLLVGPGTGSRVRDQRHCHSAALHVPQPAQHQLFSPAHSHSMVPGGLEVTSYTTRFTLRTAGRHTGAGAGEGQALQAH